MGRTRVGTGIAVSLTVVVLLLGALELGARVLAPDETRPALRNYRRYLLTGEMRLYEPRAYTVYQIRNGNAFGFDDGPWTVARTPGVPRILCLGGSTTQGGNALGRRGAYPYLLERLLEARLGRDFEVLNAGVAGWCSAEMLVAWFLALQDFRPDVLVLHEGVNDLPPRFLADFAPDYSHWRTPVRTRPVAGLERWLVRASDLYLGLRLRREGPPELLDVCTRRDGPPEPLVAEGRLPPATSRPFRRNVQSIAVAARAQGCRVVLMTMPYVAEPGALAWVQGVDENNQHLRELAVGEGLVLADAAREFAEQPERKAQFLDSVHLTPEGDQAKAELLARVLSEWLAALPAEDARPPSEASR